MSPGIKSRLPFGVSARSGNQLGYIKAISHVTDHAWDADAPFVVSDINLCARNVVEYRTSVSRHTVMTVDVKWQ